MTKDITVELQKRETIGKGLNKLRTEGTVPAVIHDHGKPSVHVMGDFRDFTKVYSVAGKHHAVQLKLDNKDHLAIIKHVDFDPKKHQIRHIVFQAIKQNEK
jgi:ribosomal protein L25 (general stress protein Ctc)